MNIVGIAIKTNKYEEIIVDLNKPFYRMADELKTSIVRTTRHINKSCTVPLKDINVYNEEEVNLCYIGKYTLTYNNITFEFPDYGELITIVIPEDLIKIDLENNVYIIYENGERINIKNFLLSLELTYNYEKNINEKLDSTNKPLICRQYLKDIDDFPKTLWIGIYSYKDNPEKIHTIHINIFMKSDELCK